VPLRKDVFVDRPPGVTIQHYNSYSDFRRLGTTENKAFTVENKLFSADPDRQKKSAENKPIFSAANRTAAENNY
jgi:hypothetical protein